MKKKPTDHHHHHHIIKITTIIFLNINRCWMSTKHDTTSVVWNFNFHSRLLMAMWHFLVWLRNFHIKRHLAAFHSKKGLTLVQALGGQEIGLFWLVDSYWGYLISHWLAILLIMVGFSTKPNAETVVCHWIMIWCWLFLTKIDVMYIVQDRWGLLADENRESLGAVNPINQWELS